MTHKDMRPRLTIWRNLRTLILKTLQGCLPRRIFEPITHGVVDLPHCLYHGISRGIGGTGRTRILMYNGALGCIMRKEERKNKEEKEMERGG